MKVCILCEDSKIRLARKNATKLFTSDDLIKIPLSESGFKPASHWFCYMDVTNEGWQKLMEVQQHTIIEKSDKDEFLLKHNLKIIK